MTTSTTALTSAGKNTQTSVPPPNGAKQKQQLSSTMNGQTASVVSPSPKMSKLAKVKSLSVKAYSKAGALATKVEFTIGYGVIVLPLISQVFYLLTTMYIVKDASPWDKAIFAINVVSIAILLGLLVVTFLEHRAKIQGDDKKRSNMKMILVTGSLINTIIGVASAILTFWNFQEQTSKTKVATIVTMVLSVLGTALDIYLVYSAYKFFKAVRRPPVNNAFGSTPGQSATTGSADGAGVTRAHGTRAMATGLRGIIQAAS